MADEKKGLTGLPKNTAGALSYVLGPITGVVFYILEKDPFVKFHAMQSIVVFGVIFIVQWSLAITIILVGISGLLGVLSFVLWLVLIFSGRYRIWEDMQECL